MSSVNKAIIIGNVGKDPEIRSTQNGRQIASLSIATSETWKDKATGERKDRTEWHRVSVFNDALVNVISNYVGPYKRANGLIKTAWKSTALTLYCRTITASWFCWIVESITIKKMRNKARHKT